MLSFIDHAKTPEADKRRLARFMYWTGWRVVDIADALDVPDPTVGSWKSRDKWDDAPVMQQVEEVASAKLMQLILKEPKDGRDIRDLDAIGRQVERFARVRRYEQPGGHEGDLNPKVAARNEGPKKKARKNYFSREAIEAIRDAFHAELFSYQEGWYDSSSLRTRVILKSRQIGATWYFAREALLDALDTGRNQIFLSASKAQAYAFRQYIVAFAHKAAGVELTGDPIVIEREPEEGEETDAEPPTLYFLGTNARTAQGYHGNFYFDEFFWVYGFTTLNKVAAGMASHKKWRKTYFSTPSSVQHEAHEFWSGNDVQKRKPKKERVELDVSHRALKDGSLGPDRRWRQIVTVEDAERGGCDLFDIEELKLENAPDEYANLYLCQFIDDALSVFPLAVMQPCCVDSWEVWADDFHPIAASGSLNPRPFGNRPVWVGYDPSNEGDSAGLVVVAPPDVPGQGKFRVLEKHRFRGNDFAAQAAFIRTILAKYNVTYLGIDVSGLGAAVYQLVKPFYPNVTGINYGLEAKVLMVLKATDVIRARRLEYDAAANDITHAFMSIRKEMTASGRNVTYVAGRSEETGHADLAWALMHVLINEPLEAAVAAPARGRMEIFE